MKLCQFLGHYSINNCWLWNQAILPSLLICSVMFRSASCRAARLRARWAWTRSLTRSRLIRIRSCSSISLTPSWFLPCLPPDDTDHCPKLLSTVIELISKQGFKFIAYLDGTTVRGIPPANLVPNKARAPYTTAKDTKGLSFTLEKELDITN